MRVWVLTEKDIKFDVEGKRDGGVEELTGILKIFGGAKDVVTLERN